MDITRNNKASDSFRKAVIQIDCDTLEELYSCYNIPAKACSDYVVSNGFSNMLDLFKKAGAPVTLFLIGRTIHNTDCCTIIQRFLKEASFPVEVASHSMTHPYNFHRLTYTEKKSEALSSKAILETKLETEVLGFKSPSYHFDETMPEILKTTGYLYDSSIWPSSMIIPMKIISGKRQNYGRWNHVFFPNRPFKHTHNLWEIPVNCSPFLRLPLHSSFIMALGRFYRYILLSSLKHLPFLCYSFHLIDFVEVKETKLQSLRGYHLTWPEKKQRLQAVLDTIQNGYTIVTGQDYLREKKE